MFKDLAIVLNDYLFGMALYVCNIYQSNQVCHWDRCRDFNPLYLETPKRVLLQTVNTQDEMPHHFELKFMY